MGYRVKAYNGDTLPVPEIVLKHLAQADGDTVRTALYVLQTKDTDPRTIARALSRLHAVPCNIGRVPGFWKAPVEQPWTHRQKRKPLPWIFLP